MTVSIPDTWMFGSQFVKKRGKYELEIEKEKVKSKYIHKGLRSTFSNYRVARSSTIDERQKNPKQATKSENSWNDNHEGAKRAIRETNR